MTFEVTFEHLGIAYAAVVTSNGKDLLANLTSPAQYETTPTIVFTVHDDNSLNFDNTMFDDDKFLPELEKAIKAYRKDHSLPVE